MINLRGRAGDQHIHVNLLSQYPLGKQNVKIGAEHQVDGCRSHSGYEDEAEEAAGVETRQDVHLRHQIQKCRYGKTDGYFLNNKCFGTYIHGILDNGVVVDHLLAPYAAKLSDTPFDFKAFKEEQYNKLADHVRKHVNMDLVYKIMKG